MIEHVVVWLKIRKHDIIVREHEQQQLVVVWLKIRKHDIDDVKKNFNFELWFD